MLLQIEASIQLDKFSYLFFIFKPTMLMYHGSRQGFPDRLDLVVVGWYISCFKKKKKKKKFIAIAHTCDLVR